MTVKFSTWIDSLVPVVTTLAATDKIAIVTDAPDARSITRDNFARSVYATVMTTDGDLITRVGGEPARVTRSGLSNDTAFTSKYTQLSTLTTDGDLYTRAGGVVTRITRASLADDTAFTSKYLTSAASSLNDLSDVDTSGAVGGSILVYDSVGTEWVVGSFSISDADDVDFTSLSDGDYLQYDNISGNWLPVPPPADPIALILALA
jgi:hypothetical protein